MPLPGRLGRPGRRRLLLGAVVALVLVAAGVTAAVLLTRGTPPEDVATDYLEATWRGDGRTECDLATDEWRHYLYNGFPFPDCASYAEAAARVADERREPEPGRPPPGFAAFADDTDVRIDTVTRSEGDGVARIEYVIELRYHGTDRAGFDALWQGGGAVDRGTMELREVDGRWRVAGVDAG